MSADGPPRGTNYSPSGGSEQSVGVSVGAHNPHLADSRPERNNIRMSRFLSSFRSQALRLSLALCALSVASCVSLTMEPRALLLQDDGAIRVQTLPCGTTTVIGPSAASNRTALDSEAIRVVTWNIHKQDDAGWERDLAQLAGGSDIVLLQEVTLEGTLPLAMRSNSSG